MSSVLAAEGGYQAFHLAGGEWAILVFAAASALLAIVVGFFLMNDVLQEGPGHAEDEEIASAIQEGAWAYLKRQFKTIAVILVPLIVVVFLTSVAVKRADGSEALSYGLSGTARTLAFLGGCLMSGLAGFIGMTLATRGNVRTAAAAKEGSMRDALTVAFRTGGVAGMFTVGLGLLGATVIIMIFQNTASAILIGFGFGGSLLALFLRVGGGIFTKAADVGADLVGKVEAGIPEDDPRNPATIADNVGDNVGDCAGMAADLFESYEVTLVASIILGVAAFNSIGANPALGLRLPARRPRHRRARLDRRRLLRAGPAGRDQRPQADQPRLPRGRHPHGRRHAAPRARLRRQRPRQRGLEVLRAPCVVGLVLAQVVSRLTEYFTGTEYGPVQEIAEASETGPATVVLSGTSSGLESSVYAIIAIAIALGVALVLGGGNLQFSLYLVALAGMGMLATTGVIVSEDTFGPVSDNAAGIAEMSGEFHGEPERIMVSLDAVGNTTKAVTKGFAIGSAVIAAVALFASFIETIGNELNIDKVGSDLFRDPLTQINVAEPEDVHRPADRRLGRRSCSPPSPSGPWAAPPAWWCRRSASSSPTARSCRARSSRTTARSSTSAPQRRCGSWPRPALLAVLSPVIIGFGIDYAALGAFLAAVILTGQLMANYLSNAGGAWDNAKKYIEDGHHGGKGSEAHKAAVIGDTVGDPFKDTAGPALNPLIKVMNLVSLLMLPAIINLQDNDAARFAIAGVSLAVLIGAVAFSKRRAPGLAAGTTPVTQAATTSV